MLVTSEPAFWIRRYSGICHLLNPLGVVLLSWMEVTVAGLTIGAQVNEPFLIRVVDSWWLLRVSLGVWVA